MFVWGRRRSSVEAFSNVTLPTGSQSVPSQITTTGRYRRTRLSSNVLSQRYPSKLLSAMQSGSGTKLEHLKDNLSSVERRLNIALSACMHLRHGRAHV
jgi:hypothetical protein